MMEYGRAHLSVPAGFMIVSLPDEAALTICCSTDLFILALSACIIPFSRVCIRERMCGWGEYGRRKRIGKPGTNLVHGCLFDGRGLLGGDRAAAFLRIGGCLVCTSRIVGSLCLQALSGTLDHCILQPVCATLSKQALIKDRVDKATCATRN